MVLSCADLKLGELHKHLKSAQDQSRYLILLDKASLDLEEAKESILQFAEDHSESSPTPAEKAKLRQSVKKSVKESQQAFTQLNKILGEFVEHIEKAKAITDALNKIYSDHIGECEALGIPQK